MQRAEFGAEVCEGGRGSEPPLSLSYKTQWNQGEGHTFGNTLIFVWSVAIACHVPRKFDPSLEFLLEQIALVEEEDDVDVCEQLLMM